ncbi:hypothetical protein AD006_28590 (plasmid) [Pseudonocardia sp. EC080610-09]|uniref:hypothetical protein n=1 Tax=unclassified Pseudonocardia TaxID=2619320 RepID=UPI000706A425|nr:MULTISPECIES: hypothetical protein [unclassified Pseudonocardia]ALL79283.1 hypothetical protein AD006_28590 [Pseudonocardia sp. EC080610-09]ALL85253.1 hypothetical protein AD017_28980 [Pseudonocardia sp. EC080619-01]
MVIPRLLLADDQQLKDLATARGWYLSETAAGLIAIGLRRRVELPDELPARLTAAEATDFTVRIPVADNQNVRAIAQYRDRSISIVAGALIALGLRHHSELPGQIPVQYTTPQEGSLTKAS